MKKHSLLLLLFAFIYLPFFGQSDSTTIYKKLTTKKMYSVGLSFQTIRGKSIYKLDGKKISKSTYDKYKPDWKNFESCCPCLLKYYDKNDNLLREIVSCTDCGVGDFKEFFPNGNVKLSGKYKENNSGNWELRTIQSRGYCSVPNGKWTYFNEKGDTLYSEFWENGAFIKQVPELNKNEIWKVDLTLNGESVEKRSLTIDEVRQLTISPKFKNSSKMETNLTVKFEVSAVGYKQNEKIFTIENFNTINVLEILSEVGIPIEKASSFNLSVYNKDKIIGSFYLTIVN